MVEEEDATYSECLTSSRIYVYLISNVRSMFQVTHEQFIVQEIAKERKPN